MSEPTFVVATFWEYIPPIDRGDRYEDPLMEVFEAEGIGDICGGGSMLSKEAGIEFVNIEMELEDLERGLQLAVATLEAQGAPKGSTLVYENDEGKQTILFGVTECLALFLDGTGLPDEVYQNTDINVLAEQLSGALAIGELGEIRSCWVGPTETALFLFGPDAERMYSAIESVLSSYPLCQNARVVVRHGKPELKPRCVQLPMHS